MPGVLSTIRLACLAGTLCATASVAAGQVTSSPPSAITLDEALTLLKERSTRTLAERAAVAVAAADRVTARTLPNPVLSYGAVHLVSGLSTGAITEHETTVEQPLLLFHQRRVRLDAAEASVKAEEAHVAESLAARRLAVRQTFASLLARQQQLRVVQDGLANLERVEQLVRGRAAAGDRSQYEVLRIETETEAFRVQAMSTVTDIEDLSRQLATLLGVPGWMPTAVGTLTPGDVPTDAGALWLIAVRRRPALIALRQDAAAARGALMLARTEGRPIPSLSAGTQTTREVNGTSLFVGVSVPLQLFDRNQGAIAKATAQVAQADLEAQAGLDEARADLEHAVAILRQRVETRRTFMQTVGQRLPALQEMAETAYREGAADILELLDALRTLRDYELANVQQLEAVKLAEEAVVAAAGLDAPEPH